jgi:hypothetical protein
VLEGELGVELGSTLGEPLRVTLGLDLGPELGSGLGIALRQTLGKSQQLFPSRCKDHRIATCLQVTRIKGNELAMRVCVAAIGPRRDSRPNDRPTRKDALPH